MGTSFLRTLIASLVVLSASPLWAAQEEIAEAASFVNPEGSGPLIVWDGSNDVSLSQGGGRRGIWASLAATPIEHFAVIASEFDGTLGVTNLRLLLQPSNLVTRCAAPSPPAACALVVGFRQAMGAARFDNANFRYPATATPLTEAQEAALAQRPTIPVDLVPGEAVGLWRLSTEGRALVASVIDAFQNVNMGLVSQAPPGRIAKLNIICLAPQPVAGFGSAVSGGPGAPDRGFPLTFPRVTQLTRSGQRLLAAVEFGRVNRSDDRGRSWQAVASPALEPVFLNVNAASPAQVFGVFLEFGQPNRVYRSADAGSTWTLYTTLSEFFLGSQEWVVFDPTTAGRLYARVGTGFVFSVDGGITWDAWIPGAPSHFSAPVFTDVPGTFYTIRMAPGSWGVWKTTNFGSSWAQVLTLNPALAPPHVAVRKVGGVTRLIALQGRRTYQSTDGGASWTSSDQLPVGATFTALAPGDFRGCTSGCGPVVAGSDRGLWVSRDEGLTWSPLLTLRPTGFGFSTIETVITSGRDVWFGTSYGVWYFDEAAPLSAPAHFGPSGGYGLFSVTRDFPEPLDTPSDGFAQFVPLTDEFGDTTIFYYVPPNEIATARSTYFHLHGRAHVIAQSGFNCTPTLTPGVLTVPAHGGRLAVTVTAGAGCSWSAGSLSASVVFVGSTERTGDGTLSFDILPNLTGSRRALVLSVAGRTVLVEQSDETSTHERIVIGAGNFAGSAGRIGVRGGAGASYQVSSAVQVPWTAYTDAGGGARVAVGDVDGDGLDEVVVGLSGAAGGSGWIAVLDDAAHGHVLLRWLRVPWDRYNSENGDVFPAVGNLDADPAAEIVAGLGNGSNGWYAIFDDASANYAFAAWRQLGWVAYNAANGTTHPAIGDVDGDGANEIVLGTGAGGAGWMAIVDAAGFAHRRWIRVHWTTYNDTGGGTWPAVGDVDGDGRGEIVVGLEQGGMGWAEIIDDSTTNFISARWLRLSWSPYNAVNGETHPAVGNVDDDPADEILLGHAAYPMEGGWAELFDDSTTSYGSLGWLNIGWPPARAAGAASYPAIGRMR